jgi:broad specificity phosphatase PhoE
MILMRHGESEFNVVYGATRTDPGIEDPSLTEDGRAQVADAAGVLIGPEPNISRIIASPYTRALQTAHIVADTLGAPITVDPLVRERFAWTCDIGTPASDLTPRWPAVRFPPLQERWWSDQEESHDDVRERADRFHQVMADDPGHPETLVVSHWGFIRAMTGLELTNAAMVRVRLGQAVEVVSHPHP